MFNTILLGRYEVGYDLNPLRWRLWLYLPAPHMRKFWRWSLLVGPLFVTRYTTKLPPLINEGDDE